MFFFEATDQFTLGCCIGLRLHHLRGIPARHKTRMAHYLRDFVCTDNTTINMKPETNVTSFDITDVYKLQ
jgi:hypothetical protein